MENMPIDAFEVPCYCSEGLETMTSDSSHVSIGRKSSANRE